jgi:tetratricopeptide (TPR) repeat protein
MPQTKRTAQQKRRSKVVLALGAAGLSLSLASSASAAIGGMKAGAASGGGENDIRIFVVANDRYPQTSTQSAPAQQKKSHAKKNRSSLEDFIAGYKAAYALIYEKGDYEAAITALRALDHDDNADVANLIGYASRKPGRYDDAKVWYERSLAADPNHAVTWSYYGMWEAEQGNLLKAKDDLEKVRLICGTTCEPYKMLKDVIEGTQTY